MECKERLCYVKNGQLIPPQERKPESYPEKLCGYIANHEDLPILYKGDEIIVLVGLPNIEREVPIWIINLTNRTYKVITEIEN